MENRSMHTPFQRVKKLRQSVTKSIPCIAAKLWCGSHIFLPIWCSTLPDLIWGWKDSGISWILSYGTKNTKGLVYPWGYSARVGKGWATRKN